MLERLISAATEDVEGYIQRKLISQEWETYFNGAPIKKKKGSDNWSGVREGSIMELFDTVNTLCLSFGPLISANVKTYASDGTATVMDPASYQLDTISPQGKIVLNDGVMWPTGLRSFNSICVTGVYGMGVDATTIPEDIKQAIILYVAKMYDNRGDDKDGEFFGTSGFTMPNTAQKLLEKYRRIMVG